MGARTFGRYFFCASLVSLFFFYAHPLAVDLPSIGFVFCVDAFVLIALCFLLSFSKNQSLFGMVLTLMLGVWFGIVLNWAVLYQTSWFLQIAASVGIVATMAAVVLCSRSFAEQQEGAQATGKLFPERHDDLKHLKTYLLAEHATDGDDIPSTLALTSDWGEGKSFLVERLMMEDDVRKAYHVIPINALVFQLDTYADVLLDLVNVALREERIFSTSALSLRELFAKGGKLRKVYDWLNPSARYASSAFELLKKDVQKLDRRILLVIEDIDRIPGKESGAESPKPSNEILQVFAISEEISRHSGGKFYIVYQYDEQKMRERGFTDAELSKYVSHTIELTPVQYHTMLESWLSQMNLPKDLQDSLEKWDGNAVFHHLKTELQDPVRSILRKRQSARKVREFLSDIRAEAAEIAQKIKENHWDAQLVYHILVAFFFTKHFLPQAFDRLRKGNQTMREWLPVFQWYGDEVKGVLTMDDDSLEDMEKIETIICFYLFGLDGYPSMQRRGKTAEDYYERRNLWNAYFQTRCLVSYFLHHSAHAEAGAIEAFHDIQDGVQAGTTFPKLLRRADWSRELLIQTERMSDLWCLFYIYEMARASRQDYDDFFSYYFHQAEDSEKDLLYRFHTAFSAMSAKAFLSFCTAAVQNGIRYHYDGSAFSGIFLESFLRTLYLNVLGGDDRWDERTANFVEGQKDWENLVETAIEDVESLQEMCAMVQAALKNEMGFWGPEIYEPILSFLNVLEEAIHQKETCSKQEQAQFSEGHMDSTSCQDEKKVLQEMIQSVQNNTEGAWDYNRIANAIRDLAMQMKESNQK